MILKFYLATFILFAVLIAAPQQIAAQQDITGGARLIFGTRPANPSAKARSRGTTANNDQVDDALALGNAARDRNPPDLDSAETAYRLAWKLNPFDPRPYVGLGNVYMDRHKFAEAAKAYQQAIRWGSSSGRGVVNSDGESPVGNREDPAAQWHAYLGAAALGEQNLRKAENELRDAIAMDPRKAEWRAGLGYSLFLQDRFTEAVRSYQAAIDLQSDDKYKRLLSDAQSKAGVASAQDSAIRKQLENSVWETDFGAAKTKGTCKLVATKAIECSFVDDEIKYSTLKWELQDGLLQLIHPTTDIRVCIARSGKEKIQLKCFVNDAKSERLWQRR